MKILQVPVRFYPYIGGVENYVLNISRALVKRGHRVKVVCANEPRSDLTQIDGIEIERLPYLCKRANTNLSLSLPIALFKEKFDVIHAHIPTPWSADWSAFHALLRNKPLFLSYYNDIVGEGFNDGLAQIYNRTFLRGVLKIAGKIFILQPDYIKASKYLNPFRDKIEVLPCGIDLNRFAPRYGAKKPLTIFFLSILDEFHKYKGLMDLLHAVAQVKQKIPNIQLIVGGEGKLKNFYKSLTSALGIQANVEFIGFIPDEDLNRYYQSASVFALPSTTHQEGFGMVLLEALACGTPVISTPLVGVAQELERYQCGVVVNPHNPTELSSALLDLLTHEKRRQTLAKNGRKLVEEKYSWNRIVEKLEKFYEDGL